MSLVVESGSQREKRIEVVCVLLWIIRWEGVAVTGWNSHTSFLPLRLLRQVYQLLHECFVRQVVLDYRLQLVPEKGLAGALRPLKEGAVETLVEDVWLLSWYF